MKRLTPILIIAALLAVPTAFGATASKAVTVIMRDPGCHWFAVGGKFKDSLTVRGSAVLLNKDEAALRIVGHGTRKVAVGKTIRLGRGVYSITMVGQYKHDNTLHLTVK